MGIPSGTFNCIVSLLGLRPSDVNVVELHDCFSANELITYEALGLCPEGLGFSCFSIINFSWHCDSKLTLINYRTKISL